MEVKLPAAQPASVLQGAVPLLRRSGLSSSGRRWLLGGARGGSSAWWERAAGEGEVSAECRLLPGVGGRSAPVEVLSPAAWGRRASVLLGSCGVGHLHTSLLHAMSVCRYATGLKP